MGKPTGVARTFADSSPIPESYWRLNHQWRLAGIGASLLPLATLWLMVAKP